MKTAYEILQEHHDFLVKDSKGIIDRPSEYIEQYILDAMEEYASQSKWISVKDSVPQKGQRVLVFCKVGQVKSTEAIRIADYFYSFKNIETQKEFKTVKFWQPLPSPPSLTD